MPEEDLTSKEPNPAPSSSLTKSIDLKPFDLDQNREETRGDLARGLLWLLTFAIGGVLVFVGLGRLDGTVITQSVFPSLIALAGTALGFYFGSQVAKNSDSSTSASSGKPNPPAGNNQA